MTSAARRSGGAPGVLVDRDGTLIRDVGHLSRVEQIEVLPRAAEALRLMRGRGLKIAIVTNQSAVGRGLLDEKGLDAIHRELEKRLAAAGASIDAIYYCPHHPTKALGSYRISCECRKPDTGMALRAAADLDLDLARSYVIGDKPSDVELAERVGALGILLDPELAANSSAAVRDIWEAAERVLADLDARTRG
ncbi:MAG TPA: HAD-IIIA family hydrolase [Candidatus Binatia bacterium]